jgi:hypothetical protein
VAGRAGEEPAAVNEHQRKHKQQLDRARQDLAEREVDHVSYERVLADMSRRKCTPFTDAIVIVHVCRNANLRKCEELRKIVADLEKKSS